MPGIVPTSIQLCIIGSTGWGIQVDANLAGQKNTDGRNVFGFMKSEESMAGEDSKLEGMCSELAGTHFMIGKIKFRWKFRSSIGLESEYSRNSHWITNGFPNQASHATRLRDSTSQIPRRHLLWITLGFRLGCSSLTLCLEHLILFFNHDSLNSL